jgi:large subunit ribosomal protein L18
MSQAVKSKQLFVRRKQRVRTALRKKAGERVRLSIYRSGKHIYAQLIDDKQGKTLVSASSMDKDLKLESSSTVDAAKSVGELIAKKAKAANIKEVVFDRGGYLFHGRVKALADAARAGGLSF